MEKASCHCTMLVFFVFSKVAFDIVSGWIFRTSLLFLGFFSLRRLILVCTAYDFTRGKKQSLSDPP